MYNYVDVGFGVCVSVVVMYVGVCVGICVTNICRCGC